MKSDRHETTARSARGAPRALRALLALTWLLGGLAAPSCRCDPPAQDADATQTSGWRQARAEALRAEPKNVQRGALTGDATWSLRLGGAGDEVAAGLALDPRQGHDAIAVVGTFEGHLEAGAEALDSLGEDDVFALRLGRAGEVAWARRLGGPGHDHAGAVVVDGQGRVVVAGGFEGTLELGDGARLESAGAEDIFVAAYGEAGELLWSRRFGGPGADGVTGVTRDPDDEAVLLTGFVSDGADLGDGAWTTEGTDAFVLRLDAAGTPAWARRLGGPGSDVGVAIARGPEGEVLVAGGFQQTLVVGDATLTSAGGRDIFLARLERDGTPTWTRSFGGARWDRGNAVAVDTDGHVTLTGYFAGAFALGDAQLEAGAQRNIFVAHLDHEGAALWTRGVTSAHLGEGEALAAFQGGSAVAGELEGVVDLGGGPLPSSDLSRDAFAAIYDIDGEHRWSARFGSAGHATFAGLAIEDDGALIVLGDFENTIDLGAGVLTSAGESDLYVARIALTSSDAPAAPTSDAPVAPTSDTP